MDLEDAYATVIDLARQSISDDGVPDEGSEEAQAAIDMVEAHALHLRVLDLPRESLLV